MQHRRFFYPASHPATPAPVRGFSWPGCFLSALSQDLCHHSRVFRPVPVLIPRTDPASAPCRSWHNFPRHPVPVQWVLLSSYPPPGFPALVHRYAPRSFMCLLTLCRLCRSLCRVGSPRTDSAPPRVVQLHPGTIPPAVPLQVSNFRPPLAISARPRRLGCYCTGLEPAPD